MNIVVKPYGSEFCYCRPDTTWERENKDFYVPECAESLYWAPVLFARVNKAVKCIGKKFVSRYYDAVGCGVLLYTGKDIAFASCADHTSLLPMPLYNPVVLEGEDNVLEVFMNGSSIWNERNLSKDAIEETVCRASSLTSLRIGDFVAVELSPMQKLVSRDEKDAQMKVSYCGNDLFDLKIVF